MKINDDFIRDNDRIRILSNDGQPTEFPGDWKPVLDSCDILVAIPDMHMYIHTQNLDNFKYNTAAMLHMLKYLSKLKRTMARRGKTLRIYQMGDMYELRFPGINGGNATVGEISMSHIDYSLIFNTLDGMRAHYLYGNHDFEQRHFASYRFFANEGKVHLEHGFAADKWTDFANPSQPLWEPAQLVFKEIRAVEQFFADLLVATSIIGKDEHFAIGVKDGSVERGDYPDGAGYPAKHPNQFEYYSERLVNGMDNEFDDDDIRICLIAHTHVPTLNTDVGGGDYILADAGAWTEGRSDFAVITDEEMAICRYARA